MGKWNARVMLCSLWFATATAGCAPPASPHAGAVAESSLADQLAAVRAKESDLIHIEAAPLRDDDLDRLVDVPGLRILQLDHADNKLTNSGMVKIARLEQLEHLRIRGGSIGDEGLKHLAGMKNLKILNLPQGEFTDAGLAQLQKLPELVMLRIGSPRVTDEGVSHLKDFPSLRRIHLIDIPLTDRGLADLQSMPRLESLYLDGAIISDAAADQLFAKRPDLHVHLNQEHHDRDPHKHDHASP